MSLRGIKVVEMLGLAPGPFCGLLLAEFGAEVTIVQKIEPTPFEVMSNGKHAIAINLKSTQGMEVLRKLSRSSDVLLDTYRPGVMEKLGLGPEILLKENPRLVYARLTGYGQDGFYHAKAGHDINYVAMSGVLSLLSINGKPPVPPINILADFAGGGLMCAFGILSALLERTSSGCGQVVDASMTEGAAYLSSWLFRSRSLPIWIGEPGTNILDGGAPFYGTYETKDGKFIAVGALEPQFFNQLLEGLQLSEEDVVQYGNFEENKNKFEQAFKKKTQQEWCEIFDELDACVTPVLDLENVSKHRHNADRNSFAWNESGEAVPVPSPRLSRTPAATGIGERKPSHGEHTVYVLKGLGYSLPEINKMASEGHIWVPNKSKI